MVSGFRFELTGGALCLDFVNTVDERGAAAPRELLGGYRALLDWGAQAGALSEREARTLRAAAERRPREAQTTLEAARALRERLFAIFSAVAGGRRPAEADLDALNRALAPTLARLRLRPGPASQMEWAWAEEPSALDRVLWPVLRSAADLLASGEGSRVRECAGETCRWLFLDRSKNASRRWCDMTVCGNRDKVRRHRLRQRAESA
jgi:predicted RNA-binding Zn ribbon-like protein